jgi:hypothetical protein
VGLVLDFRRNRHLTQYGPSRGATGSRRFLGRRLIRSCSSDPVRRCWPWRPLGFCRQLVGPFSITQGTATWGLDGHGCRVHAWPDARASGPTHLQQISSRVPRWPAAASKTRLGHTLALSLALRANKTAAVRAAAVSRTRLGHNLPLSLRANKTAAVRAAAVSRTRLGHNLIPFARAWANKTAVVRGSQCSHNGRTISSRCRFGILLPSP